MNDLQNLHHHKEVESDAGPNWHFLTLDFTSLSWVLVCTFPVASNFLFPCLGRGLYFLLWSSVLPFSSFLFSSYLYGISFKEGFFYSTLLLTIHLIQKHKDLLSFRYLCLSLHRWFILLVGWTKSHWNIFDFLLWQRQLLESLWSFFFPFFQSVSEISCQFCKYLKNL